MRRTDLFLEYGQRVCNFLDLLHRRRKIAVFRGYGEFLPRSTLGFVGQDVLKRGAKMERLCFVLGRRRSRRRRVSC